MTQASASAKQLGGCAGMFGAKQPADPPCGGKACDYIPANWRNPCLKHAGADSVVAAGFSLRINAS